MSANKNDPKDAVKMTSGGLTARRRQTSTR